MVEEPRPKAPKAFLALGLSLVSLSTLTLQVALTRVFSLLVWYHFAFLAVALALLGFTAGGLIVQRTPSLAERPAPALLARLSLWMGGAIAGALYLACKLPFEQSVLASAGQLGAFALLIGALLVPFVLSGVVVAATLSTHGESIGRLYLADLLGSGAGCVVSVAAMDRLGGGPGGVLVAGCASVLAAASFAMCEREGRGKLLSQAALALAAGLVLLGLAQNPLGAPFYVPNAKVYPRVPRWMILSRKCTSVACVDLFQNPLHFGLWGLSTTYKGPLPDQVGVVIDAWAVTSIVAAPPGPDGTPQMAHPVFEALPPSLAFQTRRAADKPPAEVLVIGAGGGLDVRTALHFGAKRVDAVEINPTIVEAVKGPFAGFAGGLYQRPDVRIAIAEGRHFLRRSPSHYDVVQISGVDTFAASQAGAFALSENYLYTVEALREYLDHLRPGGVVSFTRWLYTPPRQTLRLCTIIDRATREAGLGDGASHVVVVAAPVPGSDLDFSVVLVRREPWPADELSKLRAIAEQNAFKVIYSPDGLSPKTAFSSYFEANDRQAFIDQYPFLIAPSTDDKPFFFEHARFSKVLSSRDIIFGAASGQAVLLATLLLVMASAGVFLGLPGGMPGGKAAAPSSERPRGPWALYFVLLGLGYMAVEMSLVPRFVLYLGNPSHALSVVLFSLLCASGLGSGLSGLLVKRGAKAQAVALLSTGALLSAYPLLLSPLLEATLRAPFSARVAVTCALVAPPALLMGTAFPSAIARATAEGAGAGWAARAWVLNGYASVLMSVAAVVLAMLGGFTSVLLGGAACYLVAAAICLRAPRPAGREGVAPGA